MLRFVPTTPAEFLVVPPELLKQRPLLQAGVVLLLMLLPLPLLFLLRRASLLYRTDHTVLAVGLSLPVPLSSALSRSRVKSSSLSPFVR